MRIEKLHFKNYRGFEDFELNLKDNMLAVFVGENGSGKSSVFDGIRYLFLKLLDAKAPFGSDDVLHGKKYSELNAKLELIWQEKSFQAEIRGKEQTGDSLLDYLKDLTEENVEENISIFAYYSSLKSFEEKDIEDKAFDLLDDQLKAYYRAVATKSLRYDLFYSWFKEEENIENDFIRNEDESFRSKKLTAVKESLKQFLPDGIDFQKLRIKRHPKERMMLKYKDKELFFDQLSDGEKSILVLVGDIARRLAIANPSLENPLEGEGIVLIDEIDSHLHPKWQEEVVPALRRTFPNIQFLITTHSPHVVRNIQREDLFILKDFKIVEGKPNTYTVNIENVLYSVFNHDSRHPLMEKAVNEIVMLLEEEKLEEAAQKLEELAKVVGDLDPEVTRLKTAIDFW